MRSDKVIIGEYYRHITDTNYGWAKVIGKLKPKESPNVHTYTIFKCEWSLGRNDNCGLIKYFKGADLVKPKESDNVTNN